MKRYAVILMTSMVFFKSFQALGTDNYEIETISDSVIRKLWKGDEVSEKEIEDLFSMVAKSPTNNKMDTNHNSKTQEAKIKEWEDEMLAYVSARREKNPKKSEVIIDLSKKAEGNRGKFSAEVINDGLQFILEGY